MIAASRTVGKVVKSGGSSFGESFFDKEVPRAVELLAATEKDPGRYGGVLLLRELARTCPTHVYKHVPDILAKLYPSFKDSRVSANFLVISENVYPAHNSVSPKLWRPPDPPCIISFLHSMWRTPQAFACTMRFDRVLRFVCCDRRFALLACSSTAAPDALRVAASPRREPSSLSSLPHQVSCARVAREGKPDR